MRQLHHKNLQSSSALIYLQSQFVPVGIREEQISCDTIEGQIIEVDRYLKRKRGFLLTDDEGNPVQH